VVRHDPFQDDDDDDYEIVLYFVLKWMVHWRFFFAGKISVIYGGCFFFAQRVTDYQ
jgi:hypothetical protein